MATTTIPNDVEPNHPLVMASLTNIIKLTNTNYLLMEASASSHSHWLWPFRLPWWLSPGASYSPSPLNLLRHPKPTLRTPLGCAKTSYCSVLSLAPLTLPLTLLSPVPPRSRTHGISLSILLRATLRPGSCQTPLRPIYVTLPKTRIPSPTIWMLSAFVPIN